MRSTAGVEVLTGRQQTSGARAANPPGLEILAGGTRSLRAGQVLRSATREFGEELQRSRHGRPRGSEARQSPEAPHGFRHHASASPPRCRSVRPAAAWKQVADCRAEERSFS